MTKRQLIDEILSMNTTADPAFLAEFGSGDLEAYLTNLRRALEEQSRQPRTKRAMSALRDPTDPGRYVPQARPIHQKSAQTVVLERPAGTCGQDQEEPEESFDYPRLFEL
ncbi:MAG: hypothetical protein ACLFV7_01415 [Phycisphaerae bacterium]